MCRVSSPGKPASAKSGFANVKVGGLYPQKEIRSRSHKRSVLEFVCSPSGLVGKSSRDHFQSKRPGALVVVYPGKTEDSPESSGAFNADPGELGSCSQGIVDERRLCS